MGFCWPYSCGMATSNRRGLNSLRKLISETDHILATTELTENRTARCCELPSAAFALTDDLLTQSNLPAAVVLGAPRAAL